VEVHFPKVVTFLVTQSTLHLRYEQEVTDLLNIPDNITQAALLPVAYFKGTDFKPAKRRPAEELTYWDSWGERR
jgi:hypothetical protein